MLERAQQWIAEHNYNAFALCEWHDGKFTSVRPRPTMAALNAYSVSKTFTATAVGMLITRGQLGLNDAIVDYLGRYLPENYDRKLESVEIRHLLTHTMGHAQGYLFEEDRAAHNTDDWATFALSVPLAYAAGEKMVYSNVHHYLLSLIVEETVGKTMGDFLRDELLRPLRFTDYALGTCPLGHTFGASSMFFTCEDLAKLGVLYLNGGVYDGVRYLSKDYVRQASTPQTPDGQYGFSVWMNDGNAYRADGKYGQLILIAPEQNTVLAMQSYGDISLKEFGDYLVR